MKVLVSYGFGAGWSTWESGDLSRWMLTYQPFIEHLEAGGRLKEPPRLRDFNEELGTFYDLANAEPIVAEFAEQAHSLFGEIPYMGGIDDLFVEEVNGPFRIVEYDGRESVEMRDDMDWIIPEQEAA